MNRELASVITEKFKEKYIFDISDYDNYGGFVLITHPYWEAFVCAPESNFWIRTSSTIDLNRRLIVFPKEDKTRNKNSFSEFDKEHSQNHAAQKFFQSIPQNIYKLINRYEDCHWESVRAMTLLGNDFTDLIKSNPMMAYLIVNLEKLNPSFKLVHEVELLQRLIATKQREILRLGNFPSTESMRKIFTKIDPEHFSLNQFILFNMFFVNKKDKSNRIIKMLLHIERINKNLILLLSYEQDLCTELQVKIIRELIVSENYKSYLNILKRIYSRCKNIQMQFPLISSLNNLKEIDKQNKEKVFIRKKLLDQFPYPPLKGTETIKPIKTVNELLSWSKKQSNCIRQYSKAVKSKKCYFYKIIFNTEEATLEVKIESKQIRLGSLLGSGNRDVSPRLKKHVMTWFNKAKKTNY
jgi:hypothetical protein